MKILVINCGTSTLKFQLLELGGEATSLGQERRLAGGVVEHIGGQAALELAVEGGERLRDAAALADHDQATRRVLDWLSSVGFSGPGGLDAVGHRIVHGGDRFLEPVVVDDEVIDAIEAVSRLAPLHNGPALSAMRAAGAMLGPAVLMVATFDTAFHRTLPERAAQYAIPADLAAKHHIRRFGFHGLAHRYMVERYAAVTATPVEQLRLVTLQLGNGCSAAAIEAGRSADTSMGFTPLEGLMMGTRSGDLDPSLAGFLAREEGVDVRQVEGWLNTRSGLLGVSERSADMRELLEAEGRGDARAALAVDMFCYRVRKCIGAYLAALGGARAVVFGGGIGEHAPAVRARVLRDMGWCGLTLDEDRNTRTVGSDGRISTDDSPLQAYVIAVDEAAIIARDTARCLYDRART
jgi:acetate kinase